jgi:hypothetical protein
MNKHLEIAIIFSVLVLALFSFKSTFGQSGSLDNANTTYRNELINYLLGHNMTVNNTQLKVNELLNINTSETPELEAVVNGHKNDCQSGTFDRFAASSNLSDAEISDKFGNC